MNEEIVRKLLRGTSEVIPVDEFKRKIQSKKRLRVKLGIDATGPDIHLGFAVVLRKMREFQDLGHTAVLIVGDFTAMIGDPSGRSKTRKQLTEDEIKENMKNYKKQILKILREDNLEFRYNSEWLGKLSITDFVKLASKTTVARILERDDFQIRLEENIPISLHEILYPLFQAYDSVAVNADIELGGTDQKFNHLMGRELQREFGLEPQVVMLLPLLEGTDGVRKMSKSYNNYIGINEEPDNMFGKIMSIPDNLIYRYFQLCTDSSDEELEVIKSRLSSENPMNLKLELGYRIVSMYHSEKEAKEARENFLKVFSRRETPEKMKEIKLKKGERLWIVKLIMLAGLGNSSSEIRRTISQGGLKINNEKITDVNKEITIDGEMIIKYGKKSFIKVIPE
uniref:Tyrosine--tRNA ligase n=1 Tax=candidate division WOR-3 bacterium TaxID=2052148 RepID=A0A7C4YAJ8_UNCW3